jgi:hypothetical protein
MEDCAEKMWVLFIMGSRFVASPIEVCTLPAHDLEELHKVAYDDLAKAALCHGEGVAGPATHVHSSLA